MPVFACRWPNGNTSFVFARNKEIAIELLDEIDDASCGAELVMVRDFMLHCTLTDAGSLALSEDMAFGERTYEFVLDKLYPILSKALPASCDIKDLAPDQLRAAVNAERTRIPETSGPDAETEFGKHVRQLGGMPASLVNRLIKQHATERLKKKDPSDSNKH